MPCSKIGETYYYTQLGHPQKIWLIDEPKEIVVFQWAESECGTGLIL